MSDSTITALHARRVWDSRGRPTVEAEVRLACGAMGRGIAPAGASRGSREAIDLRDGGERLGGLDVLQAIANVNGPIAGHLCGRDAADQAGIDGAIEALDGTANRSRLGANATVAVSMAVANAAAAADRVPLWQHLACGDVSLPLPEIQIVGGGAHAARCLDLQDIMVMPFGATSFAQAIEMCAEVYHAAGALLAQSGRVAGVADEGGWWPRFDANEEALELVVRAIETAGLRPGFDVAISLDVAASELRAGAGYRFALDRQTLDREQLASRLLAWIERFPIASIEDPFDQDDEEGWIAFTRSAGSRIQIIGDDFLVTRADRVEAASRTAACNAVLVKPNQVGTLTAAHDALRAARSAGFGSIVSARSGETEDVTIAHLAVGWNAGQIKVGSLARGERTAKWNELLRIEDALGRTARFAGRSALPMYSACASAEI